MYRGVYYVKNTRRIMLLSKNNIGRYTILKLYTPSPANISSLHIKIMEVVIIGNNVFHSRLKYDNIDINIYYCQYLCRSVAM